ncbi:MAG TPA: CsgG/HfaB family protein [Gemmatimonadales bacterium]|nr:CsgG/HfaB family protein [Gemmatimonadales bacterium]
MPRLSLPLILILAAGACAGNQVPVGPAPASVPSLEAQRALRPNDAGVLVPLGAAYLEAGELAKAREALASAAAQSGLSGRERGNIDALLRLVTRREFAEEARAAVARESTLGAEPPPANTVAVLPWRYAGANAELEPLGRGLTHLVITDLSKVNRLRLLERERVQALVDELALTDSGRVDPSSGARSGRLLRAGQVVQGTLQETAGGRYRLDGTIVNATDAAVLATGAADDDLRQLFAMEKEVVVELLRRVGITLTPAEERALSERPTADLQAFLAFSRGLEAEDRGDFSAAEREYEAALQSDPAFRSARDGRDGVRRLSQAQLLAPELLARLGDARDAGQLRPAALRLAMTGVAPSSGAAIERRIGGRPPSRSSLSEALRLDDPRTLDQVGLIIIIVGRP